MKLSKLKPGDTFHPKRSDNKNYVTHFEVLEYKAKKLLCKNLTTGARTHKMASLDVIQTNKLVPVLV